MCKLRKYISGLLSRYTGREGELQGLVDARTNTLRQSEERYRGLVQSQRDFVVRMDLGGRFLFVNDAFARALGRDAQSMIGDDWRNLIHPNDIAATGADIARAVAPPNYRATVENRLLVAGPTLWVAWEGCAIFDVDGQPTEMQAVGRDITERKKMELELRKTSSSLRALVNGIPDLVWVKDNDGVYTTCNPEFGRFFGDNEKNIIGKTDHDFVDRELADFFRQKDRNAMEAGSACKNEEWITYRSDGHRVLLETIKTPIHSSSGDIVGILGIGRDITERKKAEETVRASEEKLRGLFELSPLGIALTDMKGRYVEFNEALRRICGYSDEELRTLDYWALTPKKYEMDEARQLASLERTGRYGPYEKEYRRKDGSLIPLRLNGILLKGENGVSYIWSIIEDISERRHNEEIVRQQSADLHRSNAELEQFAYVASHDLREPLRMISSYIAILEKRYGDLFDADAKDFIYFAKDGAKRMDQMVLDLLDFSRVGRMSDPFAALSLKEVIDTAIGDLKLTIEETSAEVVSSNNLPTVTGSRGELIRLVQNLIGNALKYRHPNRSPWVSITVASENAELVLSVSDNGIGIDPEYFERIFNIFQRLHTREKYDGTGIGLAVCKKIVEHHGGRIWVESKPGQGSTFSFTLPAAT